MGCKHSECKFEATGNGENVRVICASCGFMGPVGSDEASAARLWTEKTGAPGPKEFDPTQLLETMLENMKGVGQHSTMMIGIYNKLVFNLSRMADSMTFDALARVIAAGVPVEKLIQAEETFRSSQIQRAMKGFKQAEKLKPMQAGEKHDDQ